MTPFAIQIGHFQSVQVDILGIGDLGLPAKTESAHGDTISGIGMRGNRQSSRGIDLFVGC